MTRFFRCDPQRVRRKDPFLMIAADPPELTPQLLGDAYEFLRSFDAVIGPTSDGGWYAFGVREPARAADLNTLTDSGELTMAALRRGLRVALLPVLPAAE